MNGIKLKTLEKIFSIIFILVVLGFILGSVFHLLILEIICASIGVFIFVVSIYVKTEIAYQISMNQENIMDIESAEGALKVLKNFISNQRKNISVFQEELKKFAMEKKELELITEVERESIDAIFRAQDRRNKKKIWLDRSYSFFFGLIASLLIRLLF